MRAHPKHVIHKLRSRNIVASFAKRNDLVYFGDIGKDEAVDRPQGFCSNKTAQDHQYCHGNLGGFEISILNRTLRTNQKQGDAKNIKITLVRVYLQEAELPHFISFTNSLNTELQQFALLSDANLHEYQIVGVDQQRRFIGQPQAAMQFNAKVGPVVSHITSLPAYITVEGFSNQLLLFSDMPLSNVSQVDELVSSTLSIAQGLESLAEG